MLKRFLKLFTRNREEVEIRSITYDGTTTTMNGQRHGGGTVSLSIVRDVEEVARVRRFREGYAAMDAQPVDFRLRFH